jgi:hypothetical protein
MKGAKRLVIALIIFAVIIGGLAVFILAMTGVFTDKTYEYVSYEYKTMGDPTEDELADGISDHITEWQTAAEKNVAPKLIKGAQSIKVVTNSKTLKVTTADGETLSYNYTEGDDGSLSFRWLYSEYTTSTLYCTITFTDDGFDISASVGSMKYNYVDKPNEKKDVGLNIVMHYAERQ